MFTGIIQDLVKIDESKKNRSRYLMYNNTDIDDKNRVQIPK